jgi:hypothetical protein
MMNSSIFFNHSLFRSRCPQRPKPQSLEEVLCLLVPGVHDQANPLDTDLLQVFQNFSDQDRANPHAPVFPLHVDLPDVRIFPSYVHDHAVVAVEPVH